MAQLVMHRDVLKGFAKLPVQVQKRIGDFVDRIRADPGDPALRLHPLKESMTDPKVRGADLPNGYRAIIIAPDKGDLYVMAYVDKHDAAYAWARNKRFEVHPSTGVFQIFDSEEVAAMAKEQAHAPARPSYPLARMSEDELFQAGVPRPLIPAVRAVASDGELESLMAYLPPDCRDVLHGIAAGMTLEEALEEMLGVEAEAAQAAAVEGPGDFSLIAQRPSFDLVIVDGEDELRRVLEASLEEWRIFLHPYQRKLVEWRTKGPMKITGAAGTGKTVALLHRAVRLAERLERPGDRILLTTFTTNLSITLKDYIRKLNPEAANRIEVTNLHALARTICSRAGWRGRIAADEELDDIWAEVWKDPSIGEWPMPQEDLRAEFEQIVDPNGIDSEDAYLTTVRSGRPRISRAQRRKAWPVFVAVQRGVKRRNLMTFDGAIHQARMAVQQGRVPRYAHVLVDEVQDFSLEAVRLIRALSPIEEGTADPLCLVGDGHQRIYRSKFPLSRAGIDTRGRSRRLKVNYRTTEQIRRYAQAILEGMKIDDFEDGSVLTIGDRSVFRGPMPEIVPCADEAAECRAIVTWAQHLLEEGKFATHEICVTPFKRTIMEALHTAGIQVFQLRPREMDPGSDEPGIRLGTMKRIKGLEFRAVAMACGDPADPINRLAAAAPLLRAERYVAATRARENLLITVHAPTDAGGEATHA